MKALSLMSSLFSRGVKYFLPTITFKKTEDNILALLLSNLIFLSLLATCISSVFSLFSSGLVNLHQLVCSLFFVMAAYILKGRGNLTFASQLIVGGIFLMSISIDSVQLNHLYWFIVSLISSFVLLERTNAYKSVLFYCSLFFVQCFYLGAKGVVIGETIHATSYEYLLSFALFLGLGFWLKRPKSLLIEELIKISNDLVKENDQLKLENEKLKRQIHRLKTCCVEIPRMEENPDVLSSKKAFMEEALLEEDELNEILEEINNL